MRNQLPYAVECKSSYPFFERIAAFNCDVAAIGYAEECAAANRAFSYRVMKGKTVVATPVQVACAPSARAMS